MPIFYGPLHMDVPVLIDQQKLIYIHSARTLDVIWKTYRERWTIGMDGERDSEKYELSARLDEDIYL